MDGTRSNVPSCMQIIPTLLNNFVESEDCLYINIFTPVQTLTNIKRYQSLPVMVWIYGGGFLVGSADSSYYGPDNLLEQNVIVIQFGYRLGSFGFLSTEDLESPGNYGLKDQHMALRWVKSNIEYFGGDPNRITIFGESAGSVSVQYQLMYLNNKGLIHGAISESGSSLCAWAFQRYPKKIAFDLGMAAGINATDSKQLVNFLRHLSAEKLKSASIKAAAANSIGIMNGIPFAPTMESEHATAFVTNNSHQLLAKGEFLKVPYIIGFNSAEAAMVKPALSLAEPLLRWYDFDPKLLIPSGMRSDDKAGTEIKKYYFNVSNSNEYVEYINDAYFFRPIIESARLFASWTPTYLYIFTFEGILGRNSLRYNNIGEYKGVLHTEEMAYIWSREDLPEPTGLDKIVKAKMVKMWTNFAKTGNPTSEDEPLLEITRWPVVSSNMNFLDINGKLTMKHNIRKKSMVFWKDLYRKYGRPPYNTY